MSIVRNSLARLSWPLGMTFIITLILLAFAWNIYSHSNALAGAIIGAVTSFWLPVGASTIRRIGSTNEDEPTSP